MHLLSYRGLPASYAAPVAALAAFGLGIERVFVRPLRGRTLATAIVLLAVAVAGEQILRPIYSPRTPCRLFATVISIFTGIGLQHCRPEGHEAKELEHVGALVAISPDARK